MGELESVEILFGLLALLKVMAIAALIVGAIYLIVYLRDNQHQTDDERNR